MLGSQQVEESSEATPRLTYESTLAKLFIPHQKGQEKAIAWRLELIKQHNIYQKEKLISLVRQLGSETAIDDRHGLVEFIRSDLA